MAPFYFWSATLKVQSSSILARVVGRGSGEYQDYNEHEAIYVLSSHYIVYHTFALYL